MNEIMSLALESGLWAALFCFLFLYMLKDSRMRENKYTEALETLTKQLGLALNELNVCDEIKTESKKVSLTQNEIKKNTEQIIDGVDQIKSAMEEI